jgi:hypothetical protein
MKKCNASIPREHHCRFWLLLLVLMLILLFLLTQAAGAL